MFNLLDFSKFIENYKPFVSMSIFSEINEENNTLNLTYERVSKIYKL